VVPIHFTTLPQPSHQYSHGWTWCPSASPRFRSHPTSTPRAGRGEQHHLDCFSDEVESCRSAKLHEPASGGVVLVVSAGIDAPRSGGAAGSKNKPKPTLAAKSGRDKI